MLSYILKYKYNFEKSQINLCERDRRIVEGSYRIIILFVIFNFKRRGSLLLRIIDYRLG